MSLTVPPPSVTTPEPSSVPPLTSPCRLSRARGASRRASTRALMFSAAMFGSSLTSVASASSTVPFSSGARQRAARGQRPARAAPSARTRSVSADDGGDLQAAVDVEIERALAGEADAAGGRQATRPSPTARAAPSSPTPDADRDRRRLLLREREAVERDLQFGKGDRALRARRDRRESADACTSRLTRPLNPAGAPGMAAGSRPRTEALNVAGPPMRGISTGSGGTTSSGIRPDASMRRSCPSWPSAVRPRRRRSPRARAAGCWTDPARAAATGRGRCRRSRTRSGSMAFSVPRNRARHGHRAVAGEIRCRQAGTAPASRGSRAPRRRCRPAPARSVSGSAPLTTSDESPAASCSRSMSSRSFA